MLIVQELLQPRIKCRIRYPDSPFPVGAILTQDFEEPNIFHYKDSFNNHWTLEDPHLFPEVFQSIPWWEERRPEDLPLYFKVASNLGANIGNAPKPIYKIGVDAEWNIYKEHVIGVKYKSYGGLMIDYIIPCSAEEYTTYINQKKQ